MKSVICVTIRLLPAPLTMNEHWQGVTALTENVCLTFYTQINLIFEL